MRAVITCEVCGFRQRAARKILAPETFYLVCHACESVLKVQVAAQDLEAARQRVGQAA